jgi:hypothetical protein
MGGWMSPSAGLYVVVKRKIPSPYPDWNPQLVAQSYTTELSLMVTIYLMYVIQMHISCGPHNAR